MRLTRKNMHVVTAEVDERSGNRWYKIIVDLPQLHLESPNLNTSEYAHEFIDEVDKLDKTCPHCNKEV